MALASLPLPVLDMWRTAMASQDWDNPPDIDPTLDDLMRTRELVLSEVNRWPNRKGPGPALPQNAIALQMAEIFYLGKGTKPTVGASPEDGAPPSLYGDAVARMLGALGYTTHWRGPAGYGRDQIKGDRLDNLVVTSTHHLLLGDRLALKGRKSLFSLL